MYTKLSIILSMLAICMLLYPVSPVLTAVHLYPLHHISHIYLLFRCEQNKFQIVGNQFDSHTITSNQIYLFINS